MKAPFKILAISGSTRGESVNSILLKFLSLNKPKDFEFEIYKDLKNLPIFSIDDIEPAPVIVQLLLQQVKNADAIIFSSPEYVHAIPGGLKNLIDWLVPHEDIIDKPIFLIHASHRGDDLLDQLRLVLRTISAKFYEDIFARFPIMNHSQEEAFTKLQQGDNILAIEELFSKIRDKLLDGDKATIQ